MNAELKTASTAPAQVVRQLEQGNLLQRLLRHPAFPLTVSMIAVTVIFSVQSEFFLTSRNITNLLVGITPLVFVALGQIMVLLTKEIDLSLGALAGLTAAITATSIESGMPSILAICLALLVGTALGALQGAVVVFGRIASFVVTLGGSLIFLGLHLTVLGPSGGMGVSDDFLLSLTLAKIGMVQAWIAGGALTLVWLALVFRDRRARHSAGQGVVPVRRLAPRALGVAAAVILVPLYFGDSGIPLPFVIVLAVVGFMSVIMKRTPFGRHIYAVGGNLESIRRAGVRVNGLRVAAFALAGFFAALAGAFFVSSDQGVGTLTGGGTLLLQAVGVAVIGGVSLQGGRGSVWAAVFGALVLGGVNNGMDLTNNSAATKYVVQGAVVICVLLVDAYVRHGSVNAGRLGLRRRLAAFRGAERRERGEASG